MGFIGPCWAVIDCTGRKWALLGCTGLYLDVLGWAVMDCTVLYWAVLGCLGGQLVRVVRMISLDDMRSENICMISWSKSPNHPQDF